MLKRGLPTLFILLTIPGLADAKTLYVDALSGNDSTTYAANGPSTPSPGFRLIRKGKESGRG